jgi:ProP effector
MSAADITLMLIATYPKAFNRAKPLPLALNTYKAIKSSHKNVTAKPLQRALSAWTKSPRYLKAVAAGGNRFDLAGNPAGVIEPSHAQHAADTLAQRKPAGGG